MMKANIMKNVTFMLWRSFMIFFTLRPSDLITTLTYVLMDKLLEPKHERKKKCKNFT